MQRYVDLGRRRNPSLEGTSGLLEKALGKGSSFDLVQFTYYKEELGSIRQAIGNEKGSMNWVIGARGTGKSEVLNHLFSSSIQSNPKNCRLPLYISVSGGEANGEVNLKLIDRLTQKAVIDAFDYLAENQPEGFTNLQERLETANWTSKDSLLRKKVKSEDFVFSSMLKGLKGSGIGIALIIDDMDKISTESAITFYSENQTFFQSITDQYDITVVSSVTHDFMEQARTAGNMDYCVSRSRNKADELRVPDLSDLAASDTQDFINDRLRYLHWDGERWIWEGDKAPQFNTAEMVISHSNWGTYDITQMRRNGALLVLLGWLKKKGSLHLSLRQVITELETILSDHKRKKTVLLADDVDRILRANNHEEKELIEKSLISLLKEKKVDGEGITKEINLLYTLQKYPKFWVLLKDIIMDRITLGRWKGAAYKASRQQHLDLSDEDKEELGKRKSNAALLEPFVADSDAALNTILEWVSGVITDQSPPEGVFATTVDEWMGHLSGRFLIRVLEKAVLDIKASELEEKPLEKPKDFESRKTQSTPLKIAAEIKKPIKLDLDNLSPVERSWLKANEATGVSNIRDLDAKERQAVGAHFALYLCQEILKSEGAKNRFIVAVEENFYEAQKSFSKNFLSWLVLSVNPYNEHQKKKFNQISAYINGTKKTESEIRELNSSLFNIISQDPLTPAGWSYRFNVNHKAAMKPPKHFEYKIHVSNESLNLVNAILKPKETIPAFHKNQTTKVEVFITRENWNHHIDNTGIPANILPSLQQLLQWTNSIDDMIDKELFKYKGQAHKLLEDIMEEASQHSQKEFDEYFGVNGMKIPIFDSFRIDEISICLPIPREDLIRSLLAGTPSSRTIVQSRQGDQQSTVDMHSGVIPFVTPSSSFSTDSSGHFWIEESQPLSFHRNHDSIGSLIIEAKPDDGHHDEKIVFQRRPRIDGRRMKEIKNLNQEWFNSLGEDPNKLFQSLDDLFEKILSDAGKTPQQMQQTMLDFVQWAESEGAQSSMNLKRTTNHLKHNNLSLKLREMVWGKPPLKARKSAFRLESTKSKGEEE